MTGLPAAVLLRVSQVCVGGMTPLKSWRSVLSVTCPYEVEAPTFCSHCAKVAPSVKLVLTVATPGSGVGSAWLIFQFATGGKSESYGGGGSSRTQPSLFTPT